MQNRQEQNAFTLAEILITLGIIGVTAALTIPTLIANHKATVLETSLKQSYSIINQALEMYMADNGTRFTPEISSGGETKSILMKYIKFARDCGSGNRDEGACVGHYDNDEKTSKLYKNFNGPQYIDLNLFDDGQFIINNGSLVMMENMGNNPTIAPIFISVDVNGFNKRPNRLGQDLFMFELAKNSDGKLLPMGISNSFYKDENAYCSLKSHDKMNGASCTYKALTDKDFFKKLPH